MSTADPLCTVTTDDGVDLAARRWGNPHAPLTVVFSHGYCLRGISWGQQVRLLTSHCDVQAVTYDQRGHGQSGTPPAGSCTITQLGRDLDSIITALSPTTPVITVGHSMGGMAVMAHAALHPERIGQHIVGTALVSTAARGLADAGFGAPFNRPILAATRWGLTRAPRPANAIKSAILAAAGPVVQATVYGRKPRVRAHRPTDFVGDTPLNTISEFIRTLTYHDETAAFPILQHIPTVVVGGEADIATPIRNSRAIAASISGSRLHEIPDAGHLVHLEHPRLVATIIRNLTEQARTHLATASHTAAPPMTLPHSTPLRGGKVSA